jgi:hypothetical protein
MEHSAEGGKHPKEEYPRPAMIVTEKKESF